MSGNRRGKRRVRDEDENEPEEKPQGSRVTHGRVRRAPRRKQMKKMVLWTDRNPVEKTGNDVADDTYNDYEDIDDYERDPDDQAVDENVPEGDQDEEMGEADDWEGFEEFVVPEGETGDWDTDAEAEAEARTRARVADAGRNLSYQATAAGPSNAPHRALQTALRADPRIPPRLAPRLPPRAAAQPLLPSFPFRPQLSNVPLANPFTPEAFAAAATSMPPPVSTRRQYRPQRPRDYPRADVTPRSKARQMVKFRVGPHYHGLTASQKMQKYRKESLENRKLIKPLKIRASFLKMRIDALFPVDMTVETKIPACFPRNMLALNALNEDQMDELFKFYHQVPADNPLRKEYPNYVNWNLESHMLSRVPTDIYLAPEVIHAQMHESDRIEVKRDFLRGFLGVGPRVSSRRQMMLYRSLMGIMTWNARQGIVIV
jgi:hypothetical protein